MSVLRRYGATLKLTGQVLDVADYIVNASALALSFSITDPSDGQVLTYHAATQEWRNAAPSGGLSVPGITADDLIYWNGTTWARIPIGGDQQLLAFVSGAFAWVDPPGIQTPSGVGNGSLIQYNGSAWVNLASGGAPASGKVLAVNGSGQFAVALPESRSAVGTTGAATTHNGGAIVQRTAVSASYACGAGDYIIGVTNTASAVAISLPSSPATGRVIIVKDESGAAGTNSGNLTVAGAGGTTIDGASTVTYVANYESHGFYFNGTNWSKT
jgi:hypothetical protein